MRRTRGVSGFRTLASVALAGLAWMALGAEVSRAAVIQVDGVIANGRVLWSVAGAPATSVPVNPGDTVIWRAVSGRHGIVFDTQAAAAAVLQFQTGGGLPALGPQDVDGETVWGTAPQNPAGQGTVLARATVKPGVAANTSLGFFCSQHGRAMNGALAVGGGTPPPPPPAHGGGGTTSPPPVGGGTPPPPPPAGGGTNPPPPPGVGGGTPMPPPDGGHLPHPGKTPPVPGKQPPVPGKQPYAATTGHRPTTR